jgi:hypothetical protein
LTNPSWQVLAQRGPAGRNISRADIEKIVKAQAEADCISLFNSFMTERLIEDEIAVRKVFGEGHYHDQVAKFDCAADCSRMGDTHCCTAHWYQYCMVVLDKVRNQKPNRCWTGKVHT